MLEIHSTNNKHTHISLMHFANKSTVLLSTFAQRNKLVYSHNNKQTFRTHILPSRLLLLYFLLLCLDFLPFLLDRLLLLLLLLLLVHGQVDQFQYFLVLDLVLGFEQGLVEWESSQGRGLALGDHDGDFELRHECPCFLDQHWIWHQEFVVETLLQSESGHVGILEAVHAETEGGISAQDVVEELPALLDFEIVCSVEGSLVDVGPDFGLSYYKWVLLWFCLRHCSRTHPKQTHR